MPRPQIKFLDKEVPHHTFHLAESKRECRGFVCESFNEACLVLLSEQTKNEGLLTRLNDFMSTIHQDA